MGFLNPRGGSLKGGSLRGREARDWKRRNWDSDHSADRNLSTLAHPHPQRVVSSGLRGWGSEARMLR